MSWLSKVTDKITNTVNKAGKSISNAGAKTFEITASLVPPTAGAVAGSLTGGLGGIGGALGGAGGAGGIGSLLGQSGSAGLGGLFSSLLGGASGGAQTEAPTVNTSGGYGAGTPAPSGPPSWLIPAAIAGGVGILGLILILRK